MAAKGRKSKKQSGANSKSKPPEPLVLFLDRSLGKKKIATALREAGVEVRVHEAQFAPDARDEEWLRAVGRRGWVVLTKDQMIRYRGPELSALMKAGVRAFVLTAGNLKGEEMGQIFVKAVPRIRRLVAKSAGPFIARITKSGIVSMLLSGSAGDPGNR